MNERFRQLEKQSFITTETQKISGAWDNIVEPFRYVTVTETNFSLEKFAELIVQDCILALRTSECDVSDLAVEEYTRNRKRIEEHFGVSKS